MWRDEPNEVTDQLYNRSELNMVVLLDVGGELPVVSHI